MHKRASEMLTERIFQLDSSAIVDAYGPPDHAPFSVIFTPGSRLDDSHMQRIGWLLRRLKYLNVVHTRLTDHGLLALASSTSLKVVTVQFGTKPETIEELLKIPSLHRINIPIQSVLPAGYLELNRKAAWVTDHMSIYPKRNLDTCGLLPSHGTWYDLRNRSGR